MHAFTTSMQDFSLVFIGGTYWWSGASHKSWQFYVFMTVLCVRQKLTANRRKFKLFNSSLNPLEKKLQKRRCIYYNNKQTEYTARKSDTSFLILQRYFVILLWMLPSNSIYNFNFRSWMTSEGTTRKNLKKKLTNGRMPSCQKNRVSGNENRVIRPTT